MADVAKEEDAIDLPPGFRFHPTDEEIITHYLSPKLLTHGFSARAIGEVDLNKCEPWDLPSKAKMEGKDMYFFCHRDRKYPTGMRTNRATESGYWKATGKDKEIFQGKGGAAALVGMKKTLVFYKGRAPKGQKTNWVMHEFRLDGKLLLPDLPRSAKDEWVVCRVFHKSLGAAKNNKSPPPPPQQQQPADGELLFEHGGSGYYLPPLMDPPRFVQNPSSFDGSNCSNLFDFSAMMSMENHQQQQQMNNSNDCSLLYPPMQQQAAPPRSQDSCYNMMASAYDCKVEQCPSPANAGGLSIDQNTEMSSIDEPWTSYGYLSDLIN